MSETPIPTPLDELEQKWEVQERPFAADKPVIGPLIAAIRNTWNKISTKWYVLPMVQQQNEFNHRTLQHLQAQWQIMENQHAWLVAQSQEQSDLIREVGELTVQLRQLQAKLAELEEGTQGNSEEL